MHGYQKGRRRCRRRRTKLSRHSHWNFFTNDKKYVYLICNKVKRNSFKKIYPIRIGPSTQVRNGWFVPRITNAIDQYEFMKCCGASLTHYLSASPQNKCVVTKSDVAKIKRKINTCKINWRVVGSSLSSSWEQFLVVMLVWMMVMRFRCHYYYYYYYYYYCGWYDSAGAGTRNVRVGASGIVAPGQ